MTDTAKAGGEHDSSDLAHLAAEAVSKLDCRDFQSFRSAARQVSRLHFGISREMVTMYDPGDADGFADLISFFASLFADKKDAATVFGVALSTFYRWKNGDAVPHALVRATIRDTISRHLVEHEFDDLDGTSLEFGSRVRTERRPRSH